ncbi:MAG: murein tripeptide amidase MpaA [Thermoleophilia bacterium]|nr:murein tripeptide amidase MpaA [Thermoleophilia bacterium]
MEIADGWQQEEIGRSRGGLPLKVYRPVGADTIDGLLIAGIHGEEPETLLLARRLLERIDGTDTNWAILPCANPDGVLHGVRQNSAGVDLNRNFPSASWQPDHSFTYPPGAPVRKRQHRTNRSSPGDAPGSEPETQALIALIEQLEPGLILDLHSPLALIAPTTAADPLIVQRLAAAADLPVLPDIGSRTPGALRDWCSDRGVAAITYELEHAPLPALCERHLPGLAMLLTTV